MHSAGVRGMHIMRGKWIVAAVVAGAWGCGSGTGGTVDAGVDPDAGPDAGLDAGLDASDDDAGLDASDVDAGPDAGVDAGPEDAGDDAGVDAGPEDAGAEDAGAEDAGVDAGDDAGTPDAGGLALREGPAFEAPDEVIAGQLGLSRDVVDASHDAAGNLWAVSASRVFVRRAGLGAFEAFGSGDGLKDTDFLAISGGLGGVAWIGYRGVGDSEEDPPDQRNSGGAGRLALAGADLQVQDFLLIAPPGMYAAYPGGRYKLRTCWRAYGVKRGPFAGEAWFGCNHGAAQWSNAYGVLEHHHPTFCEWNAATQTCTTRAGDVPAVAFTPGDDLWFGGTYGVMQLDYADGNAGQFWGPEPVHNETLWEKPLAPNRFGSEDVTGIAVDPDGGIWATSRHSGLAHRRADGSVTIHQLVDGLPSNALVDVARDASGRLWIATSDAGVIVLDPSTGEWRRVPGLPSNQALRVVAETLDAGEVVTVTVRGGIAIYR